MKKSLFCAVLLSAVCSQTPILAADLPLNQRAPLLAVTEERATAAIKEMEFYFKGELAREIKNQTATNITSSFQQGEILRQQAKQALHDKDYASTLRFANNAIKQFNDSCQLLHPPATAEQQEEQSYQRHLSRSATFIDALKQATKDANKTADQTHIGALQQEIEQAKQLANNKQYKAANELLEQVLIASRLSISALLSGSVLEAEKDTSPKGIYEYELFRNDTYRSLLTRLHSEDETGIYSKDAFLQQQEKLGNELQQAALALAEQQSYPPASEKLAESTSAYKLAIRRVGIIIP